jgi:hypothetical protein
MILTFENLKKLYFTNHLENQGCKNNTTFQITKYFTALLEKEKGTQKRKPHMVKS